MTHTQTQTNKETKKNTHTQFRTAMKEGSARCRDLYLTTHNTQHSKQRDINAHGGIRSSNPSKASGCRPTPL